MTREECITKIKEMLTLGEAVKAAIEVYSAAKADAVALYGSEESIPSDSPVGKQLAAARAKAACLAVRKSAATAAIYPHYVRLKTRDRKAVDVHYGEGKSIAETAKALGITDRCVCYRVERAVSKILAMINDLEQN